MPGCLCLARRLHCARSTPCPDQETNHGTIHDHAARIPRDHRRRRRCDARYARRHSNRRGASRPTTRLNVGCLGTGGRCQTLMKSLAQVPGVRIAAVCDIYDAHLDAGEEARRSQGLRHQALSRAPRPQGHRRRPDRQPRPLARADGRRCLQRRQGRLRRKAADPRSCRGRGDHRRPESEPEDRPGRHAAAEHAPHPERRAS